MTGDRPAPTLHHLKPWMRRPGYDGLFGALGHQHARFVGGCVRDSLLGLDFSDVDIACQHEPQETLARLQAFGIRALPTGIEHGTVTALLPADTKQAAKTFEPGATIQTEDRKSWHAVEITSLREDVNTDGRHAEVRFTRDWHADAARRDLTMNALYLGFDGQVFDPLETGLIDARAGKVRFVGAPAQRIREDYLRLLRYFRFAAKYARQPLDTATLDTCAALAPGLARLSGERLQDELFKLLALPSCGPVLKLLDQGQILLAVWAKPLLLELAQSCLMRFAALGSPPDPLVMLRALLGHDPAGLAMMAQRLRLSNADSQRLRQAMADLALLDSQLLYHYGRRTALDSLLLADGSLWCLERFRRLQTLDIPRFPVKGKDLLAAGLEPGPDIGKRLAQTERWWAEDNFQADHSACLRHAMSSHAPNP